MIFPRSEPLAVWLLDNVLGYGGRSMWKRSRVRA